MSVNRDDPRWLQRLVANYQSGEANVFLLTGSVGDYVDQPERDETVRAYLGGRLAANFSVVCYSVDAGITFPGETSALENVRQVAAEARSRLERWCGLAPQALSEAEQMFGADDPSLGKPADLPRDPERALPLLVRLLSEADGSDPIYPPILNPDGTPMTDDGVPMVDTEKPQIGGGDGSGKRVVVLVDRLDLIVPPCDKGTAQATRLALLGLLSGVGTSAPINVLGNLLVLLAPSPEEVHADLRRNDTGIQLIDVPMPDLDARVRYLERTVARRKLELDGISLRGLATQMAGLGLRHIEDVALRAARREDRPGVLDRDLVKQRKKELMLNEYGGVLEVIEPTVTLADVGGHDAVKAWIETWVLGPAESDDPEMREAFPSGILFSGPSGTGKTMLARAIAAALGAWTFIFIRPENVKSQWVGESEKLWAKAMRGCEAMAPCVIFFDEVDQKVQRGGRGGSGGEAVENNMFGRLLEWMTEPTSRGRLLFIGATNEPQNVDPALKRPGRFGDGKLPLLAPETAEERAGVVAAALRSRGVFTGAANEPLPEKLLAIGKLTEGWTQAELGDLARRAKVLAKVGKTTVDVGLFQAVERMRPATADIKRMTLNALLECSDRTLIPATWRPIVDQIQKTEEAQATQQPRRSIPEGPREARDRSV